MGSYVHACVTSFASVPPRTTDENLRWFLRRALLGSSLFMHADPLRSRCGTVFDGWKSLVTIRRRSREEFANNRFALLFIDIDMAVLQWYSCIVTHNFRLTSPVIQFFLSMSKHAHILSKAVWVMLTKGPLTASSIRECRASDRYTSSSTLHNHFLIVVQPKIVTLSCQTTAIEVQGIICNSYIS